MPREHCVSGQATQFLDFLEKFRVRFKEKSEGELPLRDEFNTVLLEFLHDVSVLTFDDFHKILAMALQDTTIPPDLRLLLVSRLNEVLDNERVKTMEAIHTLIDETNKIFL